MVSPLVLWQHRAVLVSVLVSGFLVTLSASSGPLMTTATASAALKDKLVALSPLATGVEVAGLAGTSDRASAAAALAHDLSLQPPVLTLEAPAIPATTNGASDVPPSSSVLSVRSANGDIPVKLLARTGFRDHIQMLAETSRDGVWISDMTAQSAQVKPGGKIRLAYVEREGSRLVSLRVKGIYRALDRGTPDASWANFLPQILLQGADPPPPARFIFMTDATFASTVRALGDVPVAGTEEMAIDPAGVTLAKARTLTKRIAALNASLPQSARGHALGCSMVQGPAAGETVSSCVVTSSLQSAVAVADQSAGAISPVAALLSIVGAGVALAVGASAGLFLVRRRRAEAALLFARGESVGFFAARTAIELFVPLAVGSATGFGVALALTGSFAPSGSLDGATITSAAVRATIATALALALACGAAASGFLRLYETGTRGVQRRWLVWEVPLLAVAAWLLHDVQHGGGVVRNTASNASHPTLVVFLLPLLLVAGVAGLLTRVLRAFLRRRPGRADRLPLAVFFALRRLAGAGAVLPALVVVAGVAAGAFFYAQALNQSLTRAVAEKAAIAYGGDVQGLVSSTTPTPRGFDFPLTTVDYANQTATLGSESGPQSDVLAVDGKTLGSVIHWYSDWGRDPRPLLRSLDATSGPLAAIANTLVPAATTAVWVSGVRVPIRIVARVRAFPGMSAGLPLVVLSRDGLAAAAKRAHVYTILTDVQTYAWANGPTAQVSAALARPPLNAWYLTGADDFRGDPDVKLAQRTFGYMRLIARIAAALVLIGLLLYAQARQRSQAIASAFMGRMGLRRAAEVGSLTLELAAILLAAAAIGGAVALAAAGPIIGHIDPLPDSPPVPSLAIPTGSIVASAAGIIVFAFIVALVTNWVSRRTDMSEALRVV